MPPSAADTVQSLVEMLRRASHAYYNGGGVEDGLLDDDTYDAAVDRLRELNPTHPFLEEVGAPPPEEGAVRLPYPMPSLDKIKPGQDQLRRFLSAPAATETGFVLTEKLDGLSALWLPAGQKLFLRGDGLIGQDVSHLVGLGLGGLVKKGGPAVAIRGELLLPRSSGEALARAWVNGVIHRKAPAAADVAKLRFVAYEVVSPKGMRRSEQMQWLRSAGYELPWMRIVTATELSEALLVDALQVRRREGIYDTDGIVVGWNTAPESQSTALKAKNPKDCVAFKMPLADQSAETTVREILWATSAQGYMIPRLQFDPVQIGAATISFCTGHNARTIVQGSLGPGARVVIRRSGDVIPTLDRVVSGAPGGPALPPTSQEGVSWEWACGAGEDATTAVHIRAIGEETDAQVATRLQLFLKTLEIPGAGPSTATSLVGGGIRGPRSLWEATPARLAELLGPKTGASLHANLRTAIGSATELQLMLASSRMPRGVGETKLRAVLAVEADPSKWGCWRGGGAAVPVAPAGWTASSFQAFLSEWPKYEAWRAAEVPFLPYPADGVGVAPPSVPATHHPNAQTICCTGFRDKEMEARAITLGHTIASGMTGKVTVLVVPEGPMPSSEKVKAAQAKGIPILSRDKFATTYLK